VLERVLVLARDSGDGLVRDEVTPFELTEAGAGIVRRPSVLDAQVRHCARPEDRADHRGVVGELLLLARQAVESRADETLDARRDRQVAGLAAPPALEVDEALVPEHSHRLLEEQGVAACVLDQRHRERRRCQGRIAGEVCEERRRLIGAEGL
jgi:hypothetical protein